MRVPSFVSMSMGRNMETIVLFQIMGLKQLDNMETI